MTKRTVNQHRMLELKARLRARLANRLFTAKQTGLDGFIKRRLLKKPKRQARPSMD